MHDQAIGFLKTLLRVSAETPNPDEIQQIPWFPTDVFYAVGTLLDSAGAFSYFDPDPSAKASPKVPSLLLSFDDREKAVKLGNEWREVHITDDPSTPDGVQKLWNQLISEMGEDVIRPASNIDTAPSWWNIALQLLIISDEACADFGMPPRVNDPKFKEILYHEKVTSLKAEKNGGKEGDFEISLGSSATFTRQSNKNIANVFPKEKVSISGCSHRNFSKNLTLLPKVGNVRCHWHMPAGELKDDDDEPIDILIVPFPYNVSAKAFKAKHRAKECMANGENDTGTGWGNFRVIQEWLKKPKDCEEMAISLLKSAKQDVNIVNGVIFPEYALNFATFSKLCIELKKNEPGLEFVVGGTSSNCDKGDKGCGNFVMTCVWHNLEDSLESQAIMSSRRKHHRWMLSKEQIETYALTSSLDPRINWWESHDIGARELHFYPFRKSSLFSSLICEDLARNDPCHEVLRSVGPNLIFALLMDGPQLATRWSARYAASLSDDPGCSVLTVTSYALLDRANKTGRYDENDTVALFSSPKGLTELKLPYASGARGILINLTSELQHNQQTIDGRRKEGRVWHLSSSQPIKPLA